jgi:hypothetical protein
MLRLGPRTTELLAVASGALLEGAPVLAGGLGVVAELAALLHHRNGFFAFESALHVFASGTTSALGRSLEDWNNPYGWIAAYRDAAEDFCFFAEDIFGSQFAIRGGEVYTFDPETGESEVMASSIEDWADKLLADFEVLTGFPLAHEWQRVFGELTPGQRLVPKTPFVLGGEYATSNLYPLDAGVGMRLRAELAVHIKNSPDGTQVQYRVCE